MPRRAAISGLVIVLLAGLVPAMLAQTAPPSLTLLSREGRRALPLVSINNQDYVSLDDAAQAFGATLREDRLAGGMTVTLRGRAIVLTADQNVISAAGRLVSLAAPPVRRDGRWLVPLDFLSRALGPVGELRLDLRRASRLLVIGDLRVPRVVARVETMPNGTSVTFEISPMTPARVTPEQGRLVVQFEADALDLTTPTPPAQGFLQGITAGDTPSAVRLATGPRYGSFRTSTTQADASSSRFTVELLAAGAESTAPAPVTPAPAPAAPVTPPMDPPLMPGATTGVRTIVIDPGHGGDELGAQGSNGTIEKEITLSVGRRLRTMVESRLGMRVFLTREDDRTMSLDERTAYANNHRADLFLSIHANAAVRPGMSGAEVYYLSVERADVEAQRMAASGGATLPSLGGGSRTIDLILWETAQARFLEQSATLANFVEQSLRQRVEMSPRAVQQAPFRVLVGATMPAALVEIGYLSNPEQETALGTAAYQDRVAQALLDAITRFRDHVDASGTRPAPARSPQ